MPAAVPRGGKDPTISPAHRDQPKGQARTTLATAAEHRGDLFYLTATRHEPRLRTLQEALGRDSVFLELRNHLRAEDAWLLEVQTELGARCQTHTVVTYDVRYHDRERRPLHDVLTAIRNRATLEEIHGQLPPNSEQVLKAGDELRPLFRGHEDALTRTVELAQECRLSEPAVLGGKVCIGPASWLSGGSNSSGSSSSPSPAPQQPPARAVTCVQSAPRGRSAATRSVQRWRAP